MREKENYIVYIHTLPNGKVYIGVTSQNPLKRWSRGNGYENNTRFYRAISKYGWDNIRHEILFTDLTKEEAEQKEIELIAFYKSNQKEYGYNVLEGGFHAFNPLKVNKKELPCYDEMMKRPKYIKLFLDLFKISKPQKIIETTTTEIYNNGVLVEKKVENKERILEPDLTALYTLLDNYENEPRLKEYIEVLKDIKEKYDD